MLDVLLEHPCDEPDVLLHPDCKPPCRTCSWKQQLLQPPEHLSALTRSITHPGTFLRCLPGISEATHPGILNSALFLLVPAAVMRIKCSSRDNNEPPQLHEGADKKTEGGLDARRNLPKHNKEECQHDKVVIGALEHQQSNATHHANGPSQRSLLKTVHRDPSAETPASNKHSDQPEDKQETERPTSQRLRSTLRESSHIDSFSFCRLQEEKSPQGVFRFFCQFDNLRTDHERVQL